MEGETAVHHPEKQLEALIAHHYGLFVSKVVPCSTGWHLTTNRGTFLLSRAGKRDGTYWDMVSRLLRHLRQRGQLPKLVLTAQGKPLFSGFHSRYLLWSGQLKNLNWHSLNTWASVGRTLAHLHLASRDFTPRFTDGKYTVAGRWKMFWTQSYRMLETIGASCRLTGDPQSADREWMRVHTYAASMIETALRYFEAAGGDDEVQKYSKNGIVGQHDFTRRSWGGTFRGAVTLRTWDETVLDVRVRDIAHMLHLAYGSKTAFRDRVRVLLKHYLSVHPLSDAEWPLLYGRMLFPGPLVQTARDVYIRQTVSDAAAQEMLKRAACELERREYHLRFIPRLLKEVVGVSIPEVDWLKSSSITVHIRAKRKRKTSTKGGVGVLVWYEKLSRYFPVEEMKSEEHMELLLKEKPDLYKKEEGPNYIVMYAEFDDFLFVDYLLVAKKARGEGIGGRVIKKLKEKNKPIILEVEPLDYEDSDTVKRQRFYEREGFKKADMIGYRRRSLATGELNEMEIMYWSPTGESEQSIYEKMKRVYENIHTYKDEELYGESYQPVEDVLTVKEMR